MRIVFPHGMTQRTHTKKKQTEKTNNKKRTHKALREGIQIWRSRWQPYDFHPLALKQCAEGGGVLGIAVHNEKAFVTEESFVNIVQVPYQKKQKNHNKKISIACNVDPTGGQIDDE